MYNSMQYIQLQTYMYFFTNFPKYGTVLYVLLTFEMSSQHFCVMNNASAAAAAFHTTRHNFFKVGVVQ